MLTYKAFIRLYLAWGIALIPQFIGTKTPAIRWKDITGLSIDNLINSWFLNVERSNVTPLLGPPSKGLVCLDFDRAEGYPRFFDNRDPTTARVRGPEK